MWEWTDGSSWSFTIWQNGDEPNIEEESSDGETLFRCIQIEQSGMINWDCLELHPFICKNSLKHITSLTGSQETVEYTLDSLPLPSLQLVFRHQAVDQPSGFSDGGIDLDEFTAYRLQQGLTEQG